MQHNTISRSVHTKLSSCCSRFVYFFVLFRCRQGCFPVDFSSPRVSTAPNSRNRRSLMRLPNTNPTLSVSEGKWLSLDGASLPELNCELNQLVGNGDALLWSINSVGSFYALRNWTNDNLILFRWLSISIVCFGNIDIFSITRKQCWEEVIYSWAIV